MSTKTTYQLRLCTDGTQEVPEIIRLRRLLKSALRQFGFRAVDVREIAPPTEPVPGKDRQ